MGALAGGDSPIGEARFARLAAFPRKRGKGLLASLAHRAKRRALSLPIPLNPARLGRKPA